MKKILARERLVLFQCEESLNISKGKKKLDKVVSGRVIKEEILLFGLRIRTKFHTEYCYPVIDMDDKQAIDSFEKTKKHVIEKCMDKICEYYNQGKQ